MIGSEQEVEGENRREVVGGGGRIDGVYGGDIAMVGGKVGCEIRTSSQVAQHGLDYFSTVAGSCACDTWIAAGTCFSSVADKDQLLANPRKGICSIAACSLESALVGSAIRAFGPWRGSDRHGLGLD